MLFNHLPALLRATAPVPSRLRDGGFRFDDWAWNLGHELGFTSFDVKADEDGVTLTRPLPGWAPEHLDVRLDGRILTVKGEKPAPEGSDEDAAPAARFERKFELGFDPDPEGLDAELSLGILTLRLPKQPAPEGTVIQGSSCRRR